MAFLEELAKRLGQDVQYSYPSGVNQMAQRSLDYFMPKNAGYAEQAMPVELNAPRIPEQAALAAFGQQQTPQPEQPQNQIPEPYNMLERAFLGFGGQGQAVKEDKDRYQLAKLAESIPVDPNDKIGNALKTFAMQNPAGADKYLQYMMEKGKMQIPETKGLPEGQMWGRDANGNPIAIPIPGTTASGADVKGESELRKEFDTLGKDYRAVRDSYKRVEAATKNPSPAGDLALIFNYMKILDPGSTVREGEFATAQNATGVPGQVLNAYNKALTGERLNPEQRADFVSQAKGLHDSQAAIYNESVTKYRDLAKEYKYNPDRIVKPIDIQKTDPLIAKKAELRAKIDAIKKQKGIK